MQTEGRPPAESGSCQKNSSIGWHAEGLAGSSRPKLIRLIDDGMMVGYSLCACFVFDYLPPVALVSPATSGWPGEQGWHKIASLLTTNYAVLCLGACIHAHTPYCIAEQVRCILILQ